MLRQGSVSFGDVEMPFDREKDMYVPGYPNQVFFVTNSQPPDGSDKNLGPAIAFHTIASKRGFRPVHYTGLDARTRGSSLDWEVNDDFYDSIAIVLYLGEPKPGSDYSDNWALPAMKHALERGKACFVYTSPTFPKEILQEYGIAAIAKVISNADEFEKHLANDLNSVPKTE